MAVFTAVSASLSILIMAFAAYLTGAPFVFPALGPTTLLVFSRPMSPSASPRNVVLGHLVGCLCGWGSLAALGLLGEGPVLSAGVDLPRALAVGLSLGLTSVVLVLFNVDHPPAAATTLIVSLGLMSSTKELVVLMLAVVLISVQAIVMNRRAGFAYPLWNPAQEDWEPSEERIHPPG